MTHTPSTQDAARVRTMLSHLIEKLEEEIQNPHAGKSKHGYLWGKSDAATLLVRLTNLLIKFEAQKKSSDYVLIEGEALSAAQGRIAEHYNETHQD